MNSFAISLCHRTTGLLSGLFDIQMNVPLSEETFWEMIHMVETRLHFILTYRAQEGVVEESVFCSTGFRDVLQCKEEVAAMFGEDAVVTLDRNISFYGEASMENLYGWWDIQLVIGAPREGEENNWAFIGLQEQHMDAIWSALRQAQVMA
jgi:hypothetical protein